MEPVAGTISTSGWEFGFNRYKGYVESGTNPTIPGYARRKKASSTTNGKVYFSNIPSNCHPISLAIAAPGWATSTNTPNQGMAYVLYDYDTPSHYVVLWTGVASATWTSITTSICNNWNEDGTYYDDTFLYINDMRIWNTLAGATTIILHVYTNAPGDNYSTHIHQKNGSNSATLYYAINNDPPTGCQIEWPSQDNCTVYNIRPYFKTRANDPNGNRIKYLFQVYTYNNGGTPALIQENTSSLANSNTSVTWHMTTDCTGDAQNKYIIRVTPTDEYGKSGTTVQRVFTYDPNVLSPSGIIQLAHLTTYQTYTTNLYKWYGVANPAWDAKDVGDTILYDDINALKTKLEILPNTNTGSIVLAAQRSKIQVNTSINNVRNAILRA